MFLSLKKTPEFSIIPRANGSWGVVDNHRTSPQVVVDYDTEDEAKKAIENLRRKSIDVW